MKKNYVLFVLLLIIVKTELSAHEIYNPNYSDKSDSIKIIHPNWRIGDNFKFISQMIFETGPSEYDSARSFEITNTYDLTVIDSTENGYILSFESITNNIISDELPVSIPYQKLFNEFEALTKGVRFKLLFGINGNYIDFLNFDEASKIYMVMIDSINSKIRRGEFGDDEIVNENVEKELKMRYSLKERAVDEYLKFILPYFDVYNKEFFINEENLHKEFIVLKESSDSVYYIDNTSLVNETNKDIHLTNSVYFTPDQREKLFNVLSSNQEDQMVIRYFETLANSKQESSFIINKPNNWIKSYTHTITFNDIKQSFKFVIE